MLFSRYFLSHEIEVEARQHLWQGGNHRAKGLSIIKETEQRYSNELPVIGHTEFTSLWHVKEEDLPGLLGLGDMWGAVWVKIRFEVDAKPLAQQIRWL